MIDRPTEIVNLLGTALPTKATFFSSLVLLRGLSLFPLGILNIVKVLLNFACIKWVAKTPRQRKAVELPSPLHYGAEYGQHLLIFVITVAYWVMSPMILL